MKTGDPHRLPVADQHTGMPAWYSPASWLSKGILVADAPVTITKTPDFCMILRQNAVVERRRVRLLERPTN